MSFLDTIKEMFAGTSDGLPTINVEKRFDLLGRIGQGSMSKVWKARDRDSGKTVCLKVLDKDKTTKFEGRFKGMKKPSEGAICMLLKHANIVQALEHGWTSQKEPYIIMELIDGVGLNYLVETKSQQLEGNRVNYLTQCCNGLEYMHRTGYLHRDMCPRNVMVNKDDVVKLIDLGLTIPFTPPFCKPGNRTGTTTHLAPEIINRRTTDQRVDMFALGVTAYEMFTGDMPWEKGLSADVLKAIVNSAPRNPREFKPDMEEAIVQFLLKGIEREVKCRFQTPAEYRDALAALPGKW